MPIFEYKCQSCGKVSEVIITYGVDTIMCPECRSPAKKIISKTNFNLKGQCWAKDGYASKKETAIDRVPK